MPPAVERTQSEETQSEDTRAEEMRSEEVVSAFDNAMVSDVAPTRRLLPKKILLKLLYNPLTWLAVGAHVLLLVVPFDPSLAPSEVVEEPQEDVDESIPVDILNLSEIATAAPPPEKPPAPPEPIPTQVPAPVAPPVPSPVSEDPVPSEPVEPEEPAESDFSEDPQSEEDPLSGGNDAYDPTGNQNYFVGEIANLGIDTFTGVVAYPDASNFEKENGDSFLDFSDPLNPAPLTSSLDAKFMDEQISDVITTLNNSYGGSVNINPVESYAGELLYELSDTTGNVFMHISLVEFKTGSTLIVMWPNNPNS